MIPEELDKLLKENNTFVLEELGEGATKKIYKGFIKEKGKKVDVVVKQILPELLFSKKVKKIFRQEPAALLKISHPNVEKAYKIVESDNHLIMVCEYIEGESLAELVERRKREGRRFSVQEVVQIALQIGAGLREIHRHGFVHRDLSFSNIMVKEGEPFQVKIIDLGLAKKFGHPGLSLFFYIEGTPPFSAPEQILEPAFVDERADIFSLGTIIYYLLTERFPYGEGNDYYERVKKEKPLPLRSIRKEVGEELEKLVIECLHFQPQMRPSSEELVERLAAFASITGRDNRKPGKEERKEDGKKKIKKWFIAFIPVALILLLVAFLYLKGKTSFDYEIPLKEKSKVEDINFKKFIVDKIEVYTGTMKITYSNDFKEIKREFSLKNKKVKVFMKQVQGEVFRK